MEFDAIYSSDLARCLATAEIVAEGTGLAVTPDARLREIDTGLWEGLTQEEAFRAYPREFEEREADVTGYPFPGGESFRGLRDEGDCRRWTIILARGTRPCWSSPTWESTGCCSPSLRQLPLEELFSNWQDYCDFDVVGRSAATRSRALLREGSAPPPNGPPR